MKKMVCEICESQSLRKENGVFICQECGAEYLLEEAKKLLKEVPESIDAVKSSPSIKKETSDDSNEILISSLKIWLDYVSALEKPLSIYNIKTNTSDFWHKNVSFDYLIKNLVFLIDNTTFNKEIDKMSMEMVPENYSSFIGEYDKDSVKRCGEMHAKLYQLAIYLLKELRNEYEEKARFYSKCHEVKDKIPSQTLTDGIFGRDATILFRGLSYFESDKDFVVWCLSCCGLKTPTMYKKVTKQTLFSQKIIQEPIAFSFSFEEAANAGKFFVKQMKEEYNNIWQTTIDMTKQYCDIYQEALSHLSEIEAVFNLPIAYRDTYSIASLLNILCEGKANSWKEAATLFDTEEYRRNVVRSLSNIENELTQINETLKRGFSNLSLSLYNLNKSIHAVNESVVVANKKMDLLVDLQKKNNIYAKIIMWNTL